MSTRWFQVTADDYEDSTYNGEHECPLDAAQAAVDEWLATKGWACEDTLDHVDVNVIDDSEYDCRGRSVRVFLYWSLQLSPVDR